MNNTFFDLENQSNPLNGTVITTAEQVIELVQSLKNRDPFICKLESESGYELTIGLGPRAGFVQHSSTDGEPPYMVALGDGSVRRLQSFLICGTPTEIQAKHCLTLNDLKKICAHFVETGCKSPSADWEEI